MVPLPGDPTPRPANAAPPKSPSATVSSPSASFSTTSPTKLPDHPRRLCREDRHREGTGLVTVEELSAAYRRICRAMTIEKALFNKALADQGGTEVERLGQAWEHLCNSTSLPLFRYQASLLPAQQRARDNLLLLCEI